ncbi:hypothetical protein GW17_00010702 [Ensete ventricosum]|nr:hypothetical protein GW17_00010702 [Ensete ventricosum]
MHASVHEESHVVVCLVRGGGFPLRDVAGGSGYMPPTYPPTSLNPDVRRSCQWGPSTVGTGDQCALAGEDHMTTRWLRMHVRARQLPVFSSASVTGGRGKRGGSGAEVDCETAVNAYRNDTPSDSETSFVVFFYRVTPHDIKPLKAEKDAPVTVLADVLLKSKS